MGVVMEELKMMTEGGGERSFGYGIRKTKQHSRSWFGAADER